MNHIDTKIFFISILFTFLVVVFCGDLLYSSFINQIIFFSIPLIWPGLAHGSLDIDSAKRKKLIKNRNQLLIFLLIYISIPVTFFLLWVAYSNLSFLIFMFLSAIHFGISDQSNSKNPKIFKYLEIFIRGFLVICIPLEFHPQETKLIFNFLLAEQSFIQILEQYNDIFLFLIILSSIILLGYCLLKNKNIIIFEILLIFFCFSFFKPLVSFFIYFCFLHSTRHLINEKQQLKINTKTLVLKTIPMTIICLIPLFIAVIFPNLFFETLNFSYINYIFIGLACLTISHILLINFLKDSQTSG